jgi:cold shock CspA family protein
LEAHRVERKLSAIFAADVEGYSRLKGVFVHISARERSGLTALNEGERVIVDVVGGRKGLEAARIRLS